MELLSDPGGATAALTRSEQLFRTLVEYAGDVIMLVDAHGIIQYSTNSLTAVLGYTPAERLGRSAFEFLAEPGRTRASALLAAIVGEPGRSVRADLRAQHKDGSWRDLEVLAVNHLSDASVGAIVVTYHDITERQRTEAALRWANDRLHALIQSAPLAILALDEDVIVRAWNPAAEHLFGWTAEEVIGSAPPFVPEERREESAELFRRVLHGESLTGVELIRTRKDGGFVTTKLFAAPLVDADGRNTGVLAMIEDVTAVKRLERQFIQAQKMEAVGRLAGGVAHDFNNLLTAILGSADILLETLPQHYPDREEAVEIRKAAMKAADVTRQLLAFSRRQVLAPQTLNINTIVADVDKMLRRLIGEDIELRTALADGIGAVRADPGQIEQVIVNLVVNARDAMPGGGRILIETEGATLDEAQGRGQMVIAPGPYVMLAVTDTGTGMDAETEARIFEPFFTTKPVGKGTGLGLATVYGIVKQSEGYVWVYSKLGQGTTFKVFLPRVEATPLRIVSAPVRTVGPRGTETLLLVEDEQVVRRLAHRMLERAGYNVLVAANGTEALELAAAHVGLIDLLVTDVIMPGMNGRDVWLGLRPGRSTLKVLFVSGYTDDAIVHHGVLEPGVAFLQKPFTRDGLTRKVREVLDAPAMA